MRRLALLLVLLLPADRLRAVNPKPEKYALLVGVNKYNHAEMNGDDPLKYAEADVTELKDLLEKSGYTVDLLPGKDATKKAIDERVRVLGKKGNAGGVVLVAFAGHGVQFEKDDEAYYCPYDTDVRKAVRDGKPVLTKGGEPVLEPVPDTCVKLSDVVAQFKGAQAGTRILLADCCRNDPTTGRGRGVGAGIEQASLPRNTAVLLSCSAGQRAFEDKKWGHGAFFYQVLEGLRAGKGDADDLVVHLKATVPKMVEELKVSDVQKPHRIINGSVDFGLVAGKGRKGGEEVEFEVADGVKMVFCWIPPGKATLGSPETEKERSDDEKEHEYTSKGFWLGKYEVTQEQWTAVMGTTPFHFHKNGDGKDSVKGLDTNRYPAEVRWHDSIQFLRAVNKRGGVAKVFGAAGSFKLPHEDEWEYACRGGKGNMQAFYWGDTLNGTEANCNGNFPYGTTVKAEFKRRPKEVGRYATETPHPWGLCDMSGNASEWCDLWNRNGDAWIPTRGGEWSSNATECRSAKRIEYTPSKSPIVGFRVCFPLNK